VRDLAARAHRDLEAGQPGQQKHGSTPEPRNGMSPPQSAADGVHLVHITVQVLTPPVTAPAAADLERAGAAPAVREGRGRVGVALFRRRGA
ncbi:hypothetical protein ABZ281_26175, partial [Streptomyces sp. NPDC006265]|uniref:hypothetical protein n=1 Tax=Streptomyces sp. NPDC006265 TaxID=3156740 RepID=UPI0033A07E6D